MSWGDRPKETKLTEFIKADPNESAYPIVGADFPTVHGLTKRQYFAAMALQGLYASGQLEIPEHLDPSVEVPKLAVKVADGLIAALND